MCTGCERITELFIQVHILAGMINQQSSRSSGRLLFMDMACIFQSFQK